MVDKILSGAGFVLNETYRETRFVTPPKETYAIYNDSVNRRGADNINLLSDHETTIELYEYAPDPTAEKNIETQLDALGVEYYKEPRYWLQNEQLYQVNYIFNYINKEE